MNFEIRKSYVYSRGAAIAGIMVWCVLTFSKVLEVSLAGLKVSNPLYEEWESS